MTLIYTNPGEAHIVRAYENITLQTIINNGENSGYTQSFTNSELSIQNKLPVIHNLGKRPTSVFVWSNTEELVYPDNIEITNPNTSIAITLDSYAPITGTWIVYVI